MTKAWKRGIAPSRQKRNCTPAALAKVSIRQARQRGRRPEGLRLKTRQNHLWAVADPAVVKTVRCVSIRTRPVSWLGPETSGTHPRTKGTRCFTGGHRHRIPSTSSGLLASRSPAGRDVRRPLTRRRKHSDQWNRDERGSGRNCLLALHAVVGLQDAHTVAEGNACWGSPAGRGRFAPPSAAAGVAEGNVSLQPALGDRRRWRDGPRLPAAASSAGCVPLQSG